MPRHVKYTLSGRGWDDSRKSRSKRVHAPAPDRTIINQLFTPLTMSSTVTMTHAAVDSALTPSTSNLATIELDGYDEEQIRLMEERCILVDNDDKAYGDVSKKTCQLSLYRRPKQQLISRPPHDQHQERSTSPSILSLPLPTFRWEIVVAKEGR